MNRNISLDCYRLLLSFFVVAIHVNIVTPQLFPFLGWCISSGISRIAVPSFFIISGLFISSIIQDKNKFKKYIYKYLTIHIVWLIIYFPFFSIELGSIDFPSYIRFIIVVILGWGHLWYVPALIGGVMSIYVLKRMNVKNEILLVLALFLFLCGYLLQRVYLLGFSIPTSTLTRNFIFMGFPFIFIGYYISQKKYIGQFRANKKNMTLLITLLTLLVIESYFCYTQNRGSDFFLVLPLLSPLLLAFISKLKVNPNIDSGFIAKLSGGIYFSHNIFRFLLGEIIDVDSIKMYILVLFFSILSSVVIILLNKKIKIFL